MSFTLRPLSLEELQEFFNEDAKKIINYFIKKAIFSQPERIDGQLDLPIHIPKEHIEQRVVQALWVEWIWAGSYPVDVLNLQDKRWADVKMLSARVNKDWYMTNADSGETSLAQKFKETWKWLDQLFENQEYERIMTERLQILSNKLNSVIESQNLDHIYYFILLRGWDKLHIVWMEVNLKYLNNVVVDTERTTENSVFISNFMEKKYGYLKIYKAKKRLELRLKPRQRYEDNLCIEFDLSDSLDKEAINLLEKSRQWLDLNKYWLDKAKTIFNQ